MGTARPAGSEAMPEVSSGLDDAAVLEATAAADSGDLDEAWLDAEADAQPEVESDARSEPEPEANAQPEPATAPERAAVPGRPATGRADHPMVGPGAHLVRPDPAASGHGTRPNGLEPRASGDPPGGQDALERTATAPQLRRFIKSRAYVPMHELRRRFVINGGDDDVTPIDLEQERIYVGLPPREGSLLGELFRAGDIGFELSMDPIAPIVVGVYPMRPVPRS